MSDDRFCRFATKLVVDGLTFVDGVLSVYALNAVVNSVLAENNVPKMDFLGLFPSVPEGFHLHYDICVGGGFIAFEVNAISGPVISLQQIGESRPGE